MSLKHSPKPPAVGVDGVEAAAAHALVLAVRALVPVLVVAGKSILITYYP